MGEAHCATCGQPVDDEALRRGICPSCGGDPLALPPGAPPGLAWLTSRLLFVAVVVLFGALLHNTVLLGFALLVLAVVLLQFWRKRSTRERVRTPLTKPEGDATPGGDDQMPTTTRSGDS